jgi:hypothetical protein
MKIHIESNFVVPGLENQETVELDGESVSLRRFLEELSRKAPNPIEYARQGAGALDPDDWHVEINHVSYQNCPDGLDAVLKDGDTVTVNILAMSGG